MLLYAYADDGVLLSESAQGLQSALDSLYRYCTRWKLTLNVKKTKIMIFRYIFIHGFIMKILLK